jgi:D-alanyl-lipoteichoic acid acyltransferase DltB (MBOAT superfamily)
VAWGALNGTYLVVSIASERLRRATVVLSGLRHVPLLHNALRRLWTFHLIVVSWVFFRAASLHDALGVFRAIGTNRPGRALAFESIGGRTMVVMAVGSLIVVELLQSRVNLRGFISSRPIIIKWPAYVAFVMVLLLLGNFASNQRFIYFQF